MSRNRLAKGVIAAALLVVGLSVNLPAVVAAFKGKANGVTHGTREVFGDEVIYPVLGIDGSPLIGVAALAAADFDGVGYTDLLLVESPEGTVRVRLNLLGRQAACITDLDNCACTRS